MKEDGKVEKTALLEEQNYFLKLSRVLTSIIC